MANTGKLTVLFACLFLHACLVAGAEGGDEVEEKDYVVQSTLGKIAGHLKNENSSVVEFLGIPYASPPVGKRRWRRPYPAQSWGKKVFEADNAGPACFQKPKSAGKLSEDCLHLHVWTTSLSPEKLRPVVVYFHGGSLVEGSALSVQSSYGGEYSVADDEEGVVSVALNYRLGVLGFLAIDPFSQESPRGVSGNYGLLDCITALKFVRANIMKFGGDPMRITIYGQSSGGSIVLALLSSQLAKGLFHRAISMSGSPRLNATLEEASSFWHQQVVNRTVCKNRWGQPPASMCKCLRGMPAVDLVKAMPENWNPDSFSLDVFAPKYSAAPLLLIDGYAIQHDYLTAFSSKKNPLLSLDVPTILGVTREEADFAPSQDVRSITRDEFVGLVEASIAPYYGADFSKMVSEQYITHPTRNLMRGDLLEDGGASIGDRDVDPDDEDDGEDDDGGVAAFLPQQQVLADIVSDATEVCPTMYLASAMARGWKAPLFVYTLSHQPASPFCELERFQSIPEYCPRYSFHGLDMFALFNYNQLKNMTVEEDDRQFTKHMRSLLYEFASTGNVKSWTVFQSQAVPGADYFTMDLGTEAATLRRNLKLKACALFQSKDFYQTKAWIN